MTGYSSIDLPTQRFKYPSGGTFYEMFVLRDLLSRWPPLHMEGLPLGTNATEEGTTTDTVDLRQT